MKLTINGRSIEVPEGTMVSAAIAIAGVAFTRRSVTGEPRAPLCGMGICFECRVRVDGVDHRRACLEPVRNGMVVETGG